jgi:hypothetical protein
VSIDWSAQRIPVDTARVGERDILISIAQLLTEQLAALQHIRNSLDQPTESRSSCSVKTSTRGTDLDLKSYADGLLPRAVNEAISEYARGRRMLDELQTNQWIQTLEAVSGAS